MAADAKPSAGGTSETSEQISKIRAFWDSQAERHVGDLAATNPDPLAKELELDALKRALDPRLSTLEAGCGNGYNLFELSAWLSGELSGFDYSAPMIRAARQRRTAAGGSRPITFHVASILDDLGPLGTFDQVFTDRCLINLPTLDLQLEAVRNLGRILRPGGRMILVESTQQGQERLNALRAKVGLPPIPYRWHNLYLDEARFLERLPEGLRLVATDSFASLYFVISRVFNAKLTPAGEDPDYLAEINKIARMLPSFGDYGPLKLFRLENAA